MQPLLHTCNRNALCFTCMVHHAHTFATLSHATLLSWPLYSPLTSTVSVYSGDCVTNTCPSTTLSSGVLSGVVY